MSPSDSPSTLFAFALVGAVLIRTAFREGVRLKPGLTHHAWSNPQAREGGREVSSIGRVLIFLIGATILGRAAWGIVGLVHSR